MKAENTVPRIRANRDPRAQTYYVDMDAHREAAGLLPFPPLAKVTIGVGCALGLSAIGLIGKMLGWW